MSTYNQMLYVNLSSGAISLIRESLCLSSYLFLHLLSCYRLLFSPPQHPTPPDHLFFFFSLFFLHYGFLVILMQGDLLSSIEFTLSHSNFLMNSLALSLCAAGGQIIIYYSIKEFGALFFSTVMTLRQFISMLLSSVIYLHPLSGWQWCSTLLVFGTLYYKEALMKKNHGQTHGGPPPGK
jgi:hypothetical protein